MSKPHRWTIDDIAAGRLVCKAPGESGAADGYFAKWCYKIGWRLDGTSGRYVLICMSDGMIHNEKTPEDVLSWLRSEKMVPMREDWWVEVCCWMKTTLGLVSPVYPKNFEPKKDVNDDPVFPKEDWIYQVKNDDTSLGYAEWLTHKREDHFYNIKVGDEVEVFRQTDDPFPCDFRGKVTKIHCDGENFLTVSYSNQEEGDVSWDVYSDQVRLIEE